MHETNRLTAAFDILKRTPPQQCVQIIKQIETLCPIIKNELENRFDVPAELLWDPEASRWFLTCRYNQSSDKKHNFRSPWTNKYWSDHSENLDESYHYPSSWLRQLEIDFNTLLEKYRSIYFSGGVSSAYMWNLPENEGFGCASIIQHEYDIPSEHDVIKWDSFHVIEVIRSPTAVQFKINSSLFLAIKLHGKQSGKIDWSTVINRPVVTQKVSTDETEYGNRLLLRTMGVMLEEAESVLRMDACVIFRSKMIEIAESVRGKEPNMCNVNSNGMQQA